MSLNPHSKLGPAIQKVQFRLVLFFVYVGGLVFVAVRTERIWPVVWMHLTFVVFFGLIYFFQELIAFLLSPILLIVWPIENIFTRKYLKKFKINTPTETVVILGHPNWLTLEGWVKPIFFKAEIKYLVRLLRAQKRDFSFYPDANFNTVESAMSNRNIKEVYFLGHGNSHSFQLKTDEIIYYCDFNQEKYAKEFVHQVHCGDPYGKSLVDYVVPAQNRAQCFLFRKTINSIEIKKELKRRFPKD